MATIQTHPHMLDEILEKINSSPDVVGAIKDSLSISYVRGYLELLVSDKWTTLDITKVNSIISSYHRSMSGTLLLNKHTWNVVENIIMKPAISIRTKTVQYKAISEMLWEGESKIFSAILNKNIETLYPNITFIRICDALGNGTSKS